MKARRWFAAAALVSVVLAGCGGDDDDGAATDKGSSNGVSLADKVKASIEAENAGEAKTFLALWTDDGLAEYDSGTREEIASGKSEEFGTSHINVVNIGKEELKGDEGRVIVDATVDEKPKPFIQTVFRVAFKGTRESGAWMLDGFEFLGSPPPSDEAEVVSLTAREYEFSLDRDTVPAGDVGFKFTNEGKEPHEVTFYRAPDGVTVDAAKAALEHVDGETLEGLPAGYEVAHIGFAEPGQPAADISFSEPLGKGTYVLACYIPQGSSGDEGEGNGTPHISLGMIRLLTVE